jgi:hypothetical protein
MNPIPWLSTDGSGFLPLVFAASFLFVSLALGRRILKLSGAVSEGTDAERGVIAACLGAGALQLVPFALGIVGLFTVTALRVAGLAVCLLLIPDLRAVVMRTLRMVHTWRRSDNWVIAWVVALSPALLMATLVALTPSLDPDGLAYHLTVPKRWLDSGHLDYLPTYPVAVAPMGLELLFAWAMVFAGDSAAKCVHLVLGLLAVAAIYLAGKRLRGHMTGAVAATLFLVGPAGAAVNLGCAYLEGGAALATAGAALAWLIWFQTDSRGFLRVAALLAGIAVSFKINAALFPVALGALCLLTLYERRREANLPQPFMGAIYSLIPLVPFVAVPVIPWFTRAFILTGNPFYPVLASRIPSRDISPELATQIDSFNRYMNWGQSIGQGWSLEQRTQILLCVGLVVLLVGLFACFKLRTRMARGTAVIITITALAQLSQAGLYLRYSLPLAAALLLPLAALFTGWFARRPVMLAWVAITLVFSLTQARRIYIDDGANISGLVATAVGIQSRTTFLEQRLPLYPLYERINRDLPANAGIMLSGYCGGFHINRATFCAEMVQDSLRFTTWEEFTTDLRRLGITHLVAPSALATGGPNPHMGGASPSVITRARQYQLVRQLLTQHARTLQTASDQGLYEIDPAWLAQRDTTERQEAPRG